MSTTQRLSAFITVFILGALVVANASATLWLKGGSSLTTMSEPATTHASLTLTTTGGVLASVVECSMTFEGTVGTGAADNVKLVINLADTEQDLVECSRKSGFCMSPIMHVEKLPWSTLLELEKALTWDKYPTTTAFTLLCAGSITILCEGSTRSLFIKNIGSGAELRFEGNEQMACGNGEKGTISGKVIVLGFTIS